jgi:hypothetical protein
VVGVAAELELVHCRVVDTRTNLRHTLVLDAFELTSSLAYARSAWAADWTYAESTRFVPETWAYLHRDHKSRRVAAHHPAANVTNFTVPRCSTCPPASPLFLMCPPRPAMHHNAS